MSNTETRKRAREDEERTHVLYYGDGGHYMHKPAHKYPGDSDDEDIVELLRRSPNATTVNIQNIQICTWRMRDIGEALKGSHVRTLKLSRVSLTDPDTAEALFRSLKDTEITTLKLDATNMSVDAFFQLTETLSDSRVKRLVLELSRFLDDFKAELLADALRWTPTLEHLELGHVAANPDGIDMICAVIGDSNVRTLRVTHLGAGYWVVALAKVLARSRLRSLDLGFTHLTLNALTALNALAAALPSHRRLSVDLHDCLFHNPLAAAQRMATLSVQSAGRLQFRHIPRVGIPYDQRENARRFISLADRAAHNCALRNTSLAARCAQVLGPDAPVHLLQCTHAQANKRQCV
jgi:hypothetical protein